jgi:hypothetical protein
MFPALRTVCVASIVVLLTATGGGPSMLAGEPISVGVGALRPQQTSSDIWGYGVVRDGSSSHPLPGKDGKNSAGTMNAVERFSTGTYAVLLPGLDVGSLNAGTALVTTLGADGQHICVVDDFGWHTPDPAEI